MCGADECDACRATPAPDPDVQLREVLEYLRELKRQRYKLRQMMARHDGMIEKLTREINGDAVE